MELSFNPNNPRVITDSAISSAVVSILGFPEMMELNPIVHIDGVIYAGEVRYRALSQIFEMTLEEIGGALEAYDDARKASLQKRWQELKSAGSAPETWFRQAFLTEREAQELMVKDNTHFGTWDYEMLANVYSVKKLKLWGVSGLWDYAEPAQQADGEEPMFKPSLSPATTTFKDREVEQSDFTAAAEKIQSGIESKQVLSECTCPNCNQKIQYQL